MSRLPLELELELEETRGVDAARESERGPGTRPSGLGWGCNWRKEGMRSDCSERRSLTILLGTRCLGAPVESLCRSPFAMLLARSRAFFTNGTEPDGTGVVGLASGERGG